MKASDLFYCKATDDELRSFFSAQLGDPTPDGDEEIDADAAATFLASLETAPVFTPEREEIPAPFTRAEWVQLTTAALEESF